MSTTTLGESERRHVDAGWEPSPRIDVPRARAGHRTQPRKALQMRERSSRNDAIRPAPTDPLLNPSIPAIEPPVRAAICPSRCPCCGERCILGIGMYLAISDRVLRGRCFMPPATGSSWSHNGGLTLRRRTRPAPCANSGSRPGCLPTLQRHTDRPRQVARAVERPAPGRYPGFTDASAIPGSGASILTTVATAPPRQTSGGATASRSPRSPTRTCRADRPGTDAPAYTA